MRYAAMLVVVLGMLAGTAVRAAESKPPEPAPWEVDSLRGHKSVEVVAAFFPVEHGDALGLKGETLTDFAVDRLSKAGIEATEFDPDANGESGIPLLAFGVDIDFLLVPGSGGYVYTIQGSARQEAMLLTSREILQVGTWYRTCYGFVPAGNSEHIRTTVEGILDQFIRDWKTAQKSTKLIGGQKPSDPQTSARRRPPVNPFLEPVDPFLEHVPVAAALITGLIIGWRSNNRQGMARKSKILTDGQKPPPVNSPGPPK